MGNKNILVGINRLKASELEARGMEKGDRKFSMFYLFKNTFIEDSVISEENINVNMKLMSKKAIKDYYDNFVIKGWDEEGNDIDIHPYKLFEEDEKIYSLNNIPEQKPDTKNIFKLFRENDKDGRLHLVLYYDWSLLDNTNTRSYIVRLEGRDYDIGMALMNHKITVSMANLLITIRNLKRKNVPLFRRKEIRTKSKIRVIHAPNRELKKSLRFVNNTLYKMLDTKMKRRPTKQYAYIRNKCIIDAVKPHKNNYYSCCGDIKSFFPSTKWAYYEKYLKYLCKNESLLEELKVAFINPEDGGLYQGNPCSGTLSNLVMHKVVDYIQTIMDKREIEVSVYADDIMFSSNKRAVSKGFVFHTMKHVFEKFELDYELNPEKLEMKNGQRRRFVGLRINHRNEITVDLKKVDRLKASLFQVLNNQKGVDKRSTILGRLTFYRFVDESGKIERIIEKYKDSLSKLNFTGLDEELILGSCFVNDRDEAKRLKEEFLQRMEKKDSESEIDISNL